MKIADLMSRRVHVAGPELDAETAWRCMEQLHVRHLVVVDDREQVIGLLSERDLGGRHGASLRHHRMVRDLMTPDPIVLDPELSVHQAAELLRGLGVGSFPVVSGTALVGIITTSDLLDTLGTYEIGQSDGRMSTRFSTYE
ncbi:MAG TPA: CBS domain-containing protein [Kofleriaceae bacterium]|nr:CBS domain-containing protein [Kofleriaceae bacterium]